MSGETHDARGREAAHPLGEGAADAAPTAPHATPHAGPPPKRRSGPARFWDAKRVRRMLIATLVFSAAVHWLLAPWSLFPQKALEVREVEGELTIAIDTIDEPAPVPPPPPPSEPEKPATPDTEGLGAKRDAGPKPKDAGPHDAAKDAHKDVEIDAESLDAGPLARGEDGGTGLSDAAVALNGDAGPSSPPGANGPRDPQAMIGAAGAVQADVPLVQLLLNVNEIKKHPVGAKMGPLLSAIPEWDEFISGTNVDPVRDTEWIMIQGPSLYTRRTSKLAIIIRYSAPDALVDKAVDHVSKKYANGGPFDAGVPKVRAWLGHADFAPRVFLRPQPHVLAVVPPDYANTAAKILSRATISAKVRPGEAMRLVLKNPSRPFPFLPSTMRELRMWITPRDDGGADVIAEGDTGSPDEAEQAAKDIKKVIREQNSIGVQLVTKGLLNHAEAWGDGPTVRVKVPASEEQIQAIFDFVSAYFGVGKK